MKLNHSPFRHSRNSGFTLLEMVIVLGIISMILGGAIYKALQISDSAKLQQCNADFKSYATLLLAYKMNAGTYPTTQQGLKALVDKPTSTPVPRLWTQSMSKLSNDPWGIPYGYRFPGKKKANDFEIISKGPDGIDNTPDDLSSQDE